MFGAARKWAALGVPAAAAVTAVGGFMPEAARTCGTGCATTASKGVTGCVYRRAAESG